MFLPFFTFQDGTPRPATTATTDHQIDVFPFALFEPVELSSQGPILLNLFSAEKFPDKFL
jgi:hypothetical protein